MKMNFTETDNIQTGNEELANCKSDIHEQESKHEEVIQIVDNDDMEKVIVPKIENIKFLNNLKCNLSNDNTTMHIEHISDELIKIEDSERTSLFTLNDNTNLPQIVELYKIYKNNNNILKA